MIDPLLAEDRDGQGPDDGDLDEGGRGAANGGGVRDPDGRLRFELEETGFNEVPKKYRRFYRRWRGAGDELAPNEVLCPVCKVVIRSSRELRPGDKVYCMPCMSRLVVTLAEGGRLEATVAY